jgi:hypothetical protein
MADELDGEGNPIPEEYSTEELIRKLTSGDQLTELIGMRDFLIHELTVHRCSSCLASKLRTGDTASLAGKLTAALEAINDVRHTAVLNKAAAEGKVTGVAAIRAERGTGPGGSASPNSSPTVHGSKSSRRNTSPKRRNARS